MTQPTATLAATTSVEELVEQAHRLGLTWDLRPATINSVDTTSNLVFATYDGDAESIPMINLKGSIVAGERVMAMFVPPQGNYIIGTNVSSTTVLGENGINTPGPAGGLGTTSATFVNMGAALTFSFTKKLTNTRVVAELDGAGYSTVASSKAQYGCSVSSVGDFALADFFFNEANTHRSWSGFNYLAAGSIPAGTYTIVGRFRRLSGAGTITIDDNDRFSLGLRECY
jgi:hypothetical protein